MLIRFLIILWLLCCSACNTESNDQSELKNRETAAENTFDKTKWVVKEGKDYPYRDQMLNAVVYNDTIRTLHKDEILDLLGKPDYVNEGHLYYRITETRIALWTLHTKTMVIKLSDDSSIDWIKIHK